MLNTQEMFNECELLSVQNTPTLLHGNILSTQGLKDRNACMNQKVVTISLSVLFKSKFRLSEALLDRVPST